MNSVTIAILRRPDGLVALTSRVNKPISAPQYGSPLLIDPYLETIEPLDKVYDLSREFLRKLQLNWERLSCVTDLGQVVEDIRAILRTTVPDDVDSCVDPWKPPLVPRPPQATAAHPRAFRGTKSKPPTPPQPAAVDLRPHLCNLRDLRAILEYLSSLNFKSAASDFEQLDVAKALELFTLPRGLRLCMWTVSMLDAAQYKWSSFIRHYWALQLEESEPLRKAVARLLRDPWREVRMTWLSAVRLIASNRREAVLGPVLEYNSSGFLPSASISGIERFLVRTSELSDDESFGNRCWALLQAMHREVTIEPLLSAFEMANRFKPDHDFANKVFDEQDCTAAITGWIEYVQTSVVADSPWNRESIVMEVWDDCGQLHGLSQLFKESNWIGLSPNDAYELYYVFRHCRYCDCSELMESTFEVLRRMSQRYFQTVGTLPELYRAKGIRIFRTVAAHWEGKYLEQALSRILDLMPMVCADPFDRMCNGQIYSSILKLDQLDFETLLESDCKSLLALDRAGRNENKAALIAKGLSGLAKKYSAWLVDALVRSPEWLLELAHTLGCLSQTQQVEAMESAMQHPILLCKETELKPLASWIVQHLPRDVHDPVPRKVKAMLRGEVDLSDGQADRATKLIHSELNRTKIELIRQASIGVLAKALNVSTELAESKAVEHAIKMQNLADENRRALRKFLRAYFSGEEDYLNQHPTNLRWLQQHPAVSLEKWRRGIVAAHPSIDGTPLTLSVELNPLEVLQLGSYVGSCLGIGGMMAVSSAAVLLDINKSVVYARNQRGKVIARQLLAIAEDDQLIAFRVYPESVSQEVKQAFIDFDVAFADHLDLELYQPDPEEAGSEYPETARLISSYWWDDSAWDFSSSW